MVSVLQSTNMLQGRKFNHPWQPAKLNGAFCEYSVVPLALSML